MVLVKTPLQYCYADGAVVRPGRHAAPIIGQNEPYLRHVWHMDEESDGSAPVTRNDSHGTNHLADNNAIFSAAGLAGRGANITRPSSAEYLQGVEIARGASSVLLSFWVKFDSLAADGEWHIIAKEDTSSTGYYRFQLSRTSSTPTKLTMQWRSAGTGTGYTATSAAEFTVGTWYHVVALFDTVNDRLRAVVNGAEWINSSQPGMQAAVDEASASGLRIGNYTALDRIWPADGIVDEFEVWIDVVPDDILAFAAALYSGGSGDIYATGQTSRVQVHDEGLGHCDAGLGNGWTPATLALVLSGSAAATALRVYWSNNSTDTPTYTSYSPAAFAELTAQAYRYMWLQVEFTGSALTDTLDSVTMSTWVLDMTPPSEPPVSSAYRIGTGALQRLHGDWTNGIEAGGSTWLGTTGEWEIGGSWYMKEAAGYAPSATATPEYLGAESEKISLYMDPDDAAALGVSLADATRLRLTSWDTAGNSVEQILTVQVALTAAEEEARNTSPGVDKVLEGTTWLLLGETQTGELPANADLPNAPGVSAVNDGTGTSFTATVTGLEPTEYRGLRYRVVGSDDWTSVTSDQLGDGTIQVTGITAGGYEIEAFGLSGGGYGPTSVRAFVLVDDGTLAQYPADPLEAAKMQSRLARSRHRCTLLSLNDDSIAFDPIATTAVTRTYDSVAGLSCLVTRGLTPEVVEASAGLYAVTDVSCWLAKADLDAQATEPKVGDRWTWLNTGETYDVIGVELRLDRSAWRLILRRVDA